jgi:phosphoserine phosphatase
LAVLSQPLEAIIFDCDGTLSSIEGIDELARMNGAGEQVERLTAQAMGGSGLNPDLFRRRLEIVKPTLSQVDDLAARYFHHKTPDILSVLDTFRLLKKPIYIVSAGLFPAVQTFGEMLSIPPAQIFAVNVYFDEAGNYYDFDPSSPLVYGDGKKTIVKELCHRHSRLAYIGDGMNDLAVHDLVTVFIGYGGAFYREAIAKQCQYYISTPSMSPILPICLTADELKSTLVIS